MGLASFESFFEEFIKPPVQFLRINYCPSGRRLIYSQRMEALIAAPTYFNCGCPFGKPFCDKAASKGNVQTGILNLLNLDSKISRNVKVIIISAGGDF